MQLATVAATDRATATTAVGETWPADPGVASFEQAMRTALATDTPANPAPRQPTSSPYPGASLPRDPDAAARIVSMGVLPSLPPASPAAETATVAAHPPATPFSSPAPPMPSPSILPGGPVEPTPAQLADWRLPATRPAMPRGTASRPSTPAVTIVSSPPKTATATPISASPPSVAPPVAAPGGPSSADVPTGAPMQASADAEATSARAMLEEPPSIATPPAVSPTPAVFLPLPAPDAPSARSPSPDVSTTPPATRVAATRAVPTMSSDVARPPAAPDAASASDAPPLAPAPAPPPPATARAPSSRAHTDAGDVSISRDAPDEPSGPPIAETLVWANWTPPAAVEVMAPAQLAAVPSQSVPTASPPRADAVPALSLPATGITAPDIAVTTPAVGITSTPTLPDIAATGALPNAASAPDASAFAVPATITELPLALSPARSDATRPDRRTTEAKTPLAVLADPRDPLYPSPTGSSTRRAPAAGSDATGTVAAAPRVPDGSPPPSVAALPEHRVAAVDPTLPPCQPLSTVVDSPASAAIPPPVRLATQPVQLAHDVGLAIARQIAADGNTLHLRLEPAELGRIDVRMAFDDTGHLRAVVAADTPLSLDLLRRDSADLGRALTDAGVRSDSQSFRFEGRGDGRGDQRSGDHDQQRPAPARVDAADVELPAEIPDPTRFRPLRWRGAIDVLA